MRGRREEASVAAEHGAVAVIAALFAVVMFTLAALVVDLGNARDVRRQAQNASDAAALAASNALYLNGGVPDFAAAVAAAKEYAADNYGVTAAEWAACTDTAALSHHVEGSPACVSFDDDARPTEVRVKMPERVLPVFFAGVIADAPRMRVTAAAQAEVESSGRATCGVCVVGGGPHVIQNGGLDVTGADIHFNGRASTGPNGSVESTGGLITVEESATGSFTPTPRTAPWMTDPLAGIELPPTWSHLKDKSDSDPCDGGPGRYDEPKKFTDCKLDPGLYVITGDWKLTGKESITAEGVTLYFTCGTSASPRPCNAAGEKGGSLDASGQGGISITAPTTGPTQGLSIVYDRNNTQDLRFTGNGSATTSGTIYALSAAFDFRGNGAGNTMDSLIVVDTLVFKGNPASLKSRYTVEKNVKVPGGQIYLSK